MRGAYLTIVFPIGQNRKAAAFLQQGRWQTVSNLTSDPAKKVTSIADI